MLGDCSWDFQLKSSVTFNPNISIVKEMYANIRTPIPKALLEMTGQPDEEFCSGVLRAPTVSIVPSVPYDQNMGSKYNDRITFY